MAFNSKLLATALADPAIAKLSDADAATALSAPIITPRTGVITSLTLSQSTALGFAGAATLRATLQAAITTGQASPAGSSQATAGAFAANLLGLLDGPGIMASDPQIPAISQQLVTAGLLTQDQVNSVLTVTSYRCGGVVAASDVTAARTALALNAQATKLQQQGRDALQAYMAAIAAGVAAGALPPIATLQATLSAKIQG